MPSHQNCPPISAVTGLPLRFWRRNSRGDTWPAAEPTTWAAIARTSHRVQSVGFDQSSVAMLRMSVANFAFSAAARRIASSWSIRGIVVTSRVVVMVIVPPFACGCGSCRSR